MRGRFKSLALIGLAALPRAQPHADSLPALHHATYSVAQSVTASVPSTNPSQIGIVTPHQSLDAVPHVGAQMITSDPSALAVQATFTKRSGKTLEPQDPLNGAADSDEHENSWLDLILMLGLTLGLLAYPLIRTQSALRQSSKLAS
jgi:hypothetical protein